jgi:hypothetical protein
MPSIHHSLRMLAAFVRCALAVGALALAERCALCTFCHKTYFWFHGARAS